MHALPAMTLVRLVFLGGLWLLALSGCAGMFSPDEVRINVVGIEPLEGQGLEVRFDLKLRLQNPNETPIEYDGVALVLELNGKPFASGVSDQKGTVSRFGETVLSVPMTVSAFAAAQQALDLADGGLDHLTYVLRGKLAGGLFRGGIRFTDKGTLTLPNSGRIGG
jgi:LEA14-like dessication related protein